MPDNRVDITLPDGGLASVPAADLEQAIGAGAHVTTEQERANADIGGLGGQAATAAIGAGRMATFGLSDALLAEGANVIAPLVGQRTLRADTLKALQTAREINPGANLAGEAAGLLVGAGSATSALGGAAEASVAARLGEGLLGRAASMGARGALEGGIIGAQQHLTEDTLGDHEYNAQAIFAAGAKDALLGGAIGAGLGAGAHYLFGAPKALSATRGVAKETVLDEVAGTAGAGRQLRSDIAEQQSFVEGLRRTGATSEQAATIADAIKDAAKTRTAGPVSGAIDDIVERAAQWHGSGAAPNAAERANLIREQYTRQVSKVSDWEAKLDDGALRMAKDGTAVLRNLEDTVNDLHFGQKSSQFGKLVDQGRIDLQRDAVAAALQDFDSTLSFWESLPSRGGAEGAIGSLRKSWRAALDRAHAADEAGGVLLGRDLYMRMDQLKRETDKFLKWGGEHRFDLREAISAPNGLEAANAKLRSLLEDEGVWGQAGAAQRRLNESFSLGKARRDHFVDQAGVAIDQRNGIRIREIDFKKSRAMLSELTGKETDDALQSVRSVNEYIDGLRDRLAAAREHLEMTPQEAAKIAAGEKALNAFEETWKATRAEAATVNRLKSALLEERDAGGIGGVLGLASSVVTKPLTWANRLAQVRSTVAKVEEGVAKGMREAFGSRADSVVSAIKPRAKDAVAKEIEEVRQLSANPMSKADRVGRMLGDLPQYAGKTAEALDATATRAIDYLAREAPKPAVPIGLLAMSSASRAKPRYSDQQISEWETKRNAILNPQSVIADVKRGKLNRDAIKAIEFVSPKLFARMQEMAYDQIQQLAIEGKLDAMPYQQRAAISTLLKVPADVTWEPSFVAAMQAAKSAHAAPEAPPNGVAQPAGVAKRPIKMDPNAYATESAKIEAGGTE